MKRFRRRRTSSEQTQTQQRQAPAAAVGHASAASGGAQSAATLPEEMAASVPHALEGREMPGILFNNFDRRFLDLREIASQSLVLYVYPGCRQSLADGIDADATQHKTYCVLRKRFAEAMPGGALVALSSISPVQQFHQSPELAWDQDEGAPFQHYLVSDETLQLAGELQLPTFQRDGATYYERLTLVAREGRIQRVFHPVTAGQDARKALTWLQLH